MSSEFTITSSQMTLWRNGSASDSRSEGCVFESRQGHDFFSFLKFSNYCIMNFLGGETICKN